MIRLRLKKNPIEPSYFAIQDIQHMNEGSTRSRPASRSPVWCPPTDVYQTEDDIIVRVEIAGMREADFVILLDDLKLSIRGTRADVPERRAYHQMEIRFGDFRAEIELPAEVEVEGIEAVYGDGFLRIMLPKALPRKIEIE